MACSLNSCCTTPPPCMHYYRAPMAHASLQLDVMAEDMRELREGQTSLEALVKGEAQAAGGWPAVPSGEDSEQWIEEEVPVEASAAEQGGGAPAEAGSTAAAHTRKVRRRAEPLPVFVPLAQRELSSLQQAYDEATASFKKLKLWLKEDSELSADELFGEIHAFVSSYEAAQHAQSERRRKEREAKKRAAAMRAGGSRGRTLSRGSSSTSRQRHLNASSVASDQSAGTDGPHSEGGSDGDGEGERPQGASRRSRLRWSDTLATPAGAPVNPIAEEGEEGEEEDRGQETTAHPQLPQAASDPRQALLASIASKAAGNGGAPAQTATRGAPVPADPRAGLLASIQARAGKADNAGTSPAMASADTRSGLLASIQARGKAGEERSVSTRSTTPQGDASGSDPRASLLAAIRKREE